MPLRRVKGAPFGSLFQKRGHKSNKETIFLDKKKTILFIEDEASLQKAMGDILRLEGYEVMAALDGDIGLKLAKTKSPGLILLDLILPKKDGFEVLHELKIAKETKEIPVIVLTNLEGTLEVERALELGAYTYLVKANYDIEDVVSKIKEALQA